MFLPSEVTIREGSPFDYNVSTSLSVTSENLSFHHVQWVTLILMALFQTICSRMSKNEEEICEKPEASNNKTLSSLLPIYLSCFASAVNGYSSYMLHQQHPYLYLSLCLILNLLIVLLLLLAQGLIIEQRTKKVYGGNIKTADRESVLLGLIVFVNCILSTFLVACTSVRSHTDVLKLLYQDRDPGFKQI